MAWHVDLRAQLGCAETISANVLKAKIISVFLAGRSVALVTYYVTKIIPTCSPAIGQFFDTMIVASVDKESFSSPEAALFLVSTKNRDLWPGPTPEVRDSRTSRHSAHVQSQV